MYGQLGQQRRVGRRQHSELDTDHHIQVRLCWQQSNLRSGQRRGREQLGMGGTGGLDRAWGTAGDNRGSGDDSGAWERRGRIPVTFNFSDTKGLPDLGVENILVNNFLDGRHACYLAYARSMNTLYLVNDNGDGLLLGQALGASGTLSNSQCSVTWGSAPVSAVGNNLALMLEHRLQRRLTGRPRFLPCCARRQRSQQYRLAVPGDLVCPVVVCPVVVGAVVFQGKV